jgi:hypothetical protein
MAKILSKLQPILWSKDIKELDLTKDRIYITHQVLSCGTLSHIRWLFRVYSKKTIRMIFLNHHKKIYQPPVFYFIKNFILDLKKEKLTKIQIQKFFEKEVAKLKT